MKKIQLPKNLFTNKQWAIVNKMKAGVFMAGYQEGRRYEKQEQKRKEKAKNN